MTKSADNFKADLKLLASESDAAFLQRFFKTGPGEYGEGDGFIGVRVPDTRKVCARYIDLSLSELQNLLDSPVHEHRLGAVIILCEKYKKSEQEIKKEIYNFYLKNLKSNRINNWDIVDISAPKIIGEFLADKKKDKLYKLAKSKNLWEKRVSVIATAAFIKRGEFIDTLKLVDLHMDDTHDLMHKVCGWMLREVGKSVDETILTDYLDKNAHIMPRTMLRYSIERLSPDKRAHYLKMKFNKSAKKL